jgi:zeaxanthin epoxidase
VFLGHKQYFVSSDVGHGKMQWYAFYNEPAGGSDPPGGRKARLMELFGHWCDKVVDLLLATPEDLILRRDIYDRVPIMNWSKGRVTLLGDSAHAMQPNLGQGGCMAIEDGYQLALNLEKAMKQVTYEGKSLDIPKVLKRYEGERRLRVGAIHGLARMAAIMATTYKPYLGEGLGPLSV